MSCSWRGRGGPAPNSQLNNLVKSHKLCRQAGSHFISEKSMSPLISSSVECQGQPPTLRPLGSDQAAVQPCLVWWVPGDTCAAPLLQVLQGHEELSDPSGSSLPSEMASLSFWVKAAFGQEPPLPEINALGSAKCRHWTDIRDHYCCCCCWKKSQPHTILWDPE